MFIDSVNAAAHGYTIVTGCSVTAGRLTCKQGALDSFWIHDYGTSIQFKILIWGRQSDDGYYDIPGGDPFSGDTPLLTLLVVPLCTPAA